MTIYVTLLTFLLLSHTDASWYIDNEEISEYFLPQSMDITDLRTNKKDTLISRYKNPRYNKLYDAVVNKSPNLEKYLFTSPVKCEYKPRKTYLRTRSLNHDELTMICKKNCTSTIARYCQDCTDSTIEALAFSCKRMCKVPEGQTKYLHVFDLESDRHYCKIKISRCCTHNCLRQLGKACHYKKQLCSHETADVLKESCYSRCRTRSANVYLNTFCSFVHVPLHAHAQKRGPFSFFDD